MLGELTSSGTGARPSSRRSFLRKVLLGILAGGVVVGLFARFGPSSKTVSSASILISTPSQSGSMSVEEAIARRRSVRTYLRRPIKLNQLSQLLWAAQGTTETVNGLRSAPSAGGLYPLEVYVVVRKEGVEGLLEGVYRYDTKGQRITKVRDGDYLERLQAAALNQDAVGSSAVSLVICAVFDRTTSKYGQRGVQYVFQESGHAAENVYLQAVALALGTVVIGAFNETEVGGVIGSKNDETPVYVMPVGLPAK